MGGFCCCSDNRTKLSDENTNPADLYDQEESDLAESPRFELSEYERKVI